MRWGGKLAFVMLGPLGLGCSSEAGGGDGGATEAGDTSSDDASADGDTSGPGTGDGDDGGIPAEICDFDLRDAVQTSAILAHLDALQGVGDANETNRAAGTDGYDDSLAYVQQALADTGYEVTLDPFDFTTFEQVGPATFAQTAPSATPYTEGMEDDYVVATYSGSGDVTAPVTEVDAGSADAGCEASDFDGFTSGHIALVQRGACTFAAKVQNAEAAGAVATIIYNSGSGVFGGTLGADAGVTAPVLMISDTLGAQLGGLAGSGLQVRVAVETLIEARESHNLLAETPGGNADQVIMLGAHLDSVVAGPGINDNGSGSAMILEMALRFAACNPQQRVRFAWWGAEELGLIGSSAYVEGLSDDERDQIAAYLNYDMVASPNYVLFVFDGDASDRGNGGPPGSDIIERLFLQHFDAQGQEVRPAGFDGRSDYAAFATAGVPVGGLFTGAEGQKSSDDADAFGGQASEAFDPCYHQACDTSANLSEQALEANTAAAAYVLQKLAGDLSDLEASAALPGSAPFEFAEPQHPAGGGLEHDHLVKLPRD